MVVMHGLTPVRFAQGDAVQVTASLIDCESNGASSYRIKCYNSSYEGADVLTYLNGTFQD